MIKKSFNVEIYYEDTDFSGAVYHANYFKFIERARSKIIENIGIDQLTLQKKNSIFVVSSLSARFIRPAFFGDIVQVNTNFLTIGGASILLEQKILKQKESIFVAKVRLAFVSEGRPERLPSLIKQKLLNSDHVLS